MILEQLVVSPFQSNCWIFGCDETHEGVVIDAGDESEHIVESVKAHSLAIKYLIHTHGHLDHVGATAAVQREMGSLTLIHEADQVMLDNLPTQAAMFGGEEPEIPRVDQYIRDGDLISFGRYTLSVIETPGHSPGGICLKLENDEPAIFAGDTLFQGSIGRTDLWGGSYDQLIGSIREKLWPLPDDTIIYPGHGPSTTLGEEKQNNPFLQGL